MTANTELTGVGPALAKLLTKGGLTSAEAVASATLEDLIRIPGIGAARAAGLMKAAEGFRESAPSARPKAAKSTVKRSTPAREKGPTTVKTSVNNAEPAVQDPGNEETLSLALAAAEAAREAAELKASKAKAKAKKASRKAQNLMEEVALAKEKAKAKAKKVKAKARRAIEKEKAKAQAILEARDKEAQGKVAKKSKAKKKKKKG